MNETAEATLLTLPKEIKTIVVPDRGKGANWARNEGFKQVKTEFVLFSDNDINWHEGAVECLLETLISHPEASYAYGAYEMGGSRQCDMEFNADVLKLGNYISTMSLVRSADFPGFDEKIQRLQDWDLWLTMLEQGKTGIYCGRVIFDTPLKDGITQNGKMSWEDAFKIVKEKHFL
jgi:glycosyltransferase involved in cell wall biosynthesis